MIEDVKFSDAGGEYLSARINGKETSGISWDAVQRRDGQIATLVADHIAAGNAPGVFAPPPLTEKDYATAIQDHVDATAKAKGYANGFALAGYSTSTIPTWAAEATAFIAWRDAVWIYAHTELAKVQGGVRSQPTIAALIAELPPITWPA